MFLRLLEGQKTTYHLYLHVEISFYSFWYLACKLEIVTWHLFELSDLVCKIASVQCSRVWTKCLIWSPGINCPGKSCFCPRSVSPYQHCYRPSLPTNCSNFTPVWLGWVDMQDSIAAQHCKPVEYAHSVYLIHRTNCLTPNLFNISALCLFPATTGQDGRDGVSNSY